MNNFCENFWDYDELIQGEDNTKELILMKTTKKLFVKINELKRKNDCVKSKSIESLEMPLSNLFNKIKNSDNISIYSIFDKLMYILNENCYDIALLLIDKKYKRWIDINEWKYVKIGDTEVYLQKDKQIILKFSTNMDIPIKLFIKSYISTDELINFKHTDFIGEVNDDSGILKLTNTLNVPQNIKTTDDFIDMICNISTNTELYKLVLFPITDLNTTNQIELILHNIEIIQEIISDCCDDYKKYILFINPSFNIQHTNEYFNLIYGSKEYKIENTIQITEKVIGYIRLYIVFINSYKGHEIDKCELIECV